MRPFLEIADEQVVILLVKFAFRATDIVDRAFRY
jgi:hypothetical protein